MKRVFDSISACDDSLSRLLRSDRPILHGGSDGTRLRGPIWARSDRSRPMLCRRPLGVRGRRHTR